jgi:AraC-like DNA-binding protein
VGGERRAIARAGVLSSIVIRCAVTPLPGESGELEDARTPAVPAIYAAQLLQLVARWHIAPRELLSGSELSAAELEQSQARISPVALWELIERALSLTNEPGLGFYYGLQLKLSSHGSVGFAAMTSATLRESLHIAERFLSLRAPFLSLRLVEEGDSAALELSSLYAAETQLMFVTEALFTALIQMARSVLGRSLQGSFELSYTQPKYFADFAHLWPGPVQFASAHNRIRFARGLLDESLQMADPVAARQALSECERELSALLDNRSLVASVRLQLSSRERGYPSLTELSRQRHVSERTLKRRLAEQGTSYQKLVDGLRRERALSLLENEAHSVDQVAALLGYSDAANFNRAFRRWLGESPSSWREQHLRSKAR